MNKSVKQALLPIMHSTCYKHNLNISELDKAENSWNRIKTAVLDFTKRQHPASNTVNIPSHYYETRTKNTSYQLIEICYSTCIININIKIYLCDVRLTYFVYGVTEVAAFGVDGAATGKITSDLWTAVGLPTTCSTSLLYSGTLLGLT